MSAVKELSEAAEFICSLAVAIAEATEDGKITVGDTKHLIGLMYKLPSAVDGLSEIVMADLSTEDLEAVSEVVKKNLELNNDKIEIAVEGAIDIAIQLYALVQKIRA